MHSEGLVHTVSMGMRNQRDIDGGGILAYDIAKGEGEYNTTRPQRSEESAMEGGCWASAINATSITIVLRLQDC